MKVQDMEHSIPFSSQLERDVVSAVASRDGQIDSSQARRGNGDASAVGLDSMVFDRLLKEHILFLGSDVNSEIANRLCAQLLLLEAEDDERDIKLYINSPGGSVYDGMAIYDTMQYIKNDVATVGMGMAASMGQLLLCAGTAGKRYALPHARIMMHQPSGGIGGTASDVAILAEQMLYTKQMFQERVAEHTGRTIEEIERDSDRDRWFTAAEAKDYGFIDHVVKRVADVPAEAN